MPPDLSDLIARAEALPRPGTEGPWEERAWGIWGGESERRRWVMSWTHSSGRSPDARAIAALPEALALIDDLVAWAKEREAVTWTPTASYEPIAKTTATGSPAECPVCGRECNGRFPLCTGPHLRDEREAE